MRAVWDADVEAFADHWGFAAPVEGDYENWLKGPFTQPHLFKVAFDKDTGEIAGMVQNFIDEDGNTRFNRKRGYTEGISTRRKYRKQGVARALICESLRMLRDMGMTEAALGADADNLTGAISVYRTCGFEVVRRTTLFWKAF
jgi:ribosomal protein S18 acetylase RimI-like enzyme